jgi:triacylglycerol lipase
MLQCNQQIILWVLIFVVITIIIFYVFLYWELNNLPNTIIDTLSARFDKPCELSFPLVYREPVYVPKKNGVYEKKLAVALIDVCFMTSTGNCSAILPILSPPGFPNQLRLEGLVPVSNDWAFLAYIFWNEQTGEAIFSFTGTERKSLWQADARYQQQECSGLNNYSPGMLMHSGFYGVYTAIREQLWEWYDNNKIWLRHLFITGHSLGGALSSICAFDFAGIEAQIINYAFASPRVANVEFADIFSKLVPQSLDVVNFDDIVTQLILAQLFSYTYETLGQLTPFRASLGSLSRNHIDAYYYNLPEEPECAK